MTSRKCCVFFSVPEPDQIDHFMEEVDEFTQLGAANS